MLNVFSEVVSYIFLMHLLPRPEEIGARGISRGFKLLPKKCSCMKKKKTPFRSRLGDRLLFEDALLFCKTNNNSVGWSCSSAVMSLTFGKPFTILYSRTSMARTTLGL